MEQIRAATLQVFVSMMIFMDPNNANSIIPKSTGYRHQKSRQLEAFEGQSTSGLNEQGTVGPITTELVMEGRSSLTIFANESGIEESSPISNLSSKSLGQTVVEGTSPISIEGVEDINYMQYSLTLTRKAGDSQTFGLHFDGTKVGMITKNSPAGRIGVVQLGDEILKVNDAKITCSGDIFDVLEKAPLSIDITLRRPLPTTEHISNFATDNPLGSNNLSTSQTSYTNFHAASAVERTHSNKSESMKIIVITNSPLDEKSSHPNVTDDEDYYSGLDSTLSVLVENNTTFDSNDRAENKTSLQDIVQHPTIESWTLITDISKLADVKNQSYTTASNIGATENYEDKIENHSSTNFLHDYGTSVTEKAEITLTAMECCKNSNVPVFCHGLCIPAIPMARSLGEKTPKRPNACSQYAGIIEKCFPIPNNHDENSSCSCKDLKNRNNVGNCEGEKPTQFNTTTACYVNLPSTCSDLKESITNPGEMLSVEACKQLPPEEERMTSVVSESYVLNTLGEAEKYNKSTHSNNGTYGITESSFNLDVTGNNSDSRNMDIKQGTRNSSDENIELTKLTTISSQFSTEPSNASRNFNLTENVTNRPSKFVSFWHQYTKRFLKVLQRSKYELNDAPVRFFVRRQSFPDDSIIDLMYPETNSLAKEFKQCVLYRQCLPVEKGDSRILNDTTHTKESCLDEHVSEVCPNNTIKFELSVTGWRPGQYAPIHDHSKEGSLMNIIKGSGLRESTFWKPPESDIEDYNPSYDQELRRDYTFEDNTQFYSCFSFLQDQISKKDEDGCEYKNQTTAYITKNKSYNLTRGKIHQIRFYKGFNRLIALKNMDKNETTFTLHHNLGHNRVSWWLNNQNDARLFE